jgi:hypothetical protein
MVSPVVRMQVAKGDHLTTLRHRTIRLDDPLGCRLVQLLDGSRTVASLTTQLRQAAQEVRSEEDGAEQGKTIPEGKDGELEVKRILCNLGRLGLLLQ